MHLYLGSSYKRASAQKYEHVKNNANPVSYAKITNKNNEKKEFSTII